MNKDMQFFTIGLYNTDEACFYKKLLDSRIDTFCDIRRRRGVRGSKYAYANSLKLQAGLAIAGIRYAHILDLAPTREIRSLQTVVDKKASILKSKRQILGCDFINTYQSEVLGAFSLDLFTQKLAQIRANRVVLFCVEENPLACHRSLVADFLEQHQFSPTIHL